MFCDDDHCTIHSIDTLMLLSVVILFHWRLPIPSLRSSCVCMSMKWMDGWMDAFL